MKEKFGFEGVNRRSEVRERLERNVLEREKNFQKTVTTYQMLGREGRRLSHMKSMAGELF
jgi:hypothetical protein